MSGQRNRRFFRTARRNPQWQPPPEARVVTLDTALPSKVTGVDFTASFQGAWIATTERISDHHGYSMTMEHLWKQAESVTREWYATHSEAAQAAANAKITPRTKNHSGEVEVTGTVILAIDDQAAVFTREYLALRRDEAIRSERTSSQLYELRRALKSPGIAPLWWASNHPDQLAAIDSAPFKNLVASIADAKDESLPPQSSIEQVLQDFLSEFTGPEDRQLLMKVFLRVLHQFDKPELAKRLEQRSQPEPQRHRIDHKEK